MAGVQCSGCTQQQTGNTIKHLAGSRREPTQERRTAQDQPTCANSHLRTACLRIQTGAPERPENNPRPKTPACKVTKGTWENAACSSGLHLPWLTWLPQPAMTAHTVNKEHACLGTMASLFY